LVSCGIDWIEAKSFAYDGGGAPLTRRAVNRWAVQDRGAQSVVTTIPAEGIASGA